VAKHLAHEIKINEKEHIAGRIFVDIEPDDIR
jgi:hypothetical protein